MTKDDIAAYFISRQSVFTPFANSLHSQLYDGRRLLTAMAMPGGDLRAFMRTHSYQYEWQMDMLIEELHYLKACHDTYIDAERAAVNDTKRRADADAAATQDALLRLAALPPPSSSL